MKHLKLRVMSFLLTSIMMVTTAGAAQGSSDVVALADKPADYEKVLYFEDFEGDSELDTDSLEYKISTMTVGIEAGDATAESTKEQGNYANVAQAGTDGDGYFRMRYEEKSGKPTPPLKAQFTSGDVDKLSKMQVSFDICAMSQKRLNVYFYDKLSSTATKTWNIMYLATNGKITFSNTDTKYDFGLNKWMSFDIFVDLDEKLYSVYINGEEVVKDIAVTAALECIESFGIQTGSQTAADSYSVYMDNMRLAIPEALEIVSSSPADKSTGVKIDTDMTITLSEDVTGVTEYTVTVTGGESSTGYSVGEDNGVITITFDNDLEYETEYTVTLGSNIVGSSGKTFDENQVIKFTTESEEPFAPPAEDEASIVDYNKVLYFEDFEEDTVVDATSLEYKKSTLTATVENDEEHGNYVKVEQNGVEGDSYFRMKYEAADSPIKSQFSKDEVGELLKMQISFDICSLKKRDVYIRFYDKLSTDTTKQEAIAVFSADGKIKFSNTDITASYEVGTWMHFDVFFDFTEKTYSLYIDGNAVVSDIETKILTDCVESFGIQTGNQTAADYYGINMDNLRVAIPDKFVLAEAAPADKSTNINVTDSIVVKFTNKLFGFNSGQVCVEGGEDIPEYTVFQEADTVKIKFDGVMEFNTEYTVTLKKDITDVYGNTLGTEDKFITFTTQLPQKTASIPEFTDKVRATAVNPGSDQMPVALVVVIVNADGSETILKDEKNINSEDYGNLEVAFDDSSLQDGQSVFAFVADGYNSLNLIRDAVAMPLEVLVSDTADVSALLEKAELVGTNLKIEGSLSSQIRKNVIIKLVNQSGVPEYILPVQTDEKGAVICELSVDNIPYGKYYVSFTGYNMGESDKKTVVYLSETDKNSINKAINEAESDVEIRTLLNSGEYKEKMNLDSSLYKANTYNTLFEQIPFESYDKIIEMIYKADSLLQSINDADWTEYSELFAENSDVILKGATKLEKYNSLSANKKNSVNKLIVENSPFTDFVNLREIFDSSVTTYTDSQSSGGGSGGGGGGGGTGSGSSSDSSSAEVTHLGVEKPDTDIASESSEKLFIDMKAALWAKESVKSLCQIGIVSEAEKFRPMDNVTREEFVKMLVQLAGLQLGNKNPDFTDVVGTEWFAPYLGSAQGAGIVNGMDDGSFGVGSFITRQDMVVMAKRTVEYMNKTLATNVNEVEFADSDNISEYAKDAVRVMQKAGVVSGMGNGRFEPRAFANRAQAAVIICNLIASIK